MITHKGKILELDRYRVDEDVNTLGYLVDYNPEWTLIAKVDRDFFINGFALIRNDTIDQYGVFDHDNDFLHKSLVKLNEVPAQLPELDLSSIPSTVAEIAQAFPLLVFHQELIDNEICSVGAVSKVTDKAVTILEVSSIATVGNEYRIQMKDITMINFGAKYETAIWKLLTKKNQSRLQDAVAKK